MLCPTSFGVVCFEVATRLEPFKELTHTQVTRAVADKGKRPQIPEEASASPYVVTLMEQCWKQHPADRPDGFEPVVQALSSVVRLTGDPRSHSTVAVDVTSSSGEKRGGHAPLTGSDGVAASSRWFDPAAQPSGVDSGASPDKSNVPAPAESAGGKDGSAVEGGIPQGAAKEGMVPGTGKAYAPFADLPVASTDRPPSSATHADAAPPKFSDGVEASSRWSDPAFQPKVSNHREFDQQWFSGGHPHIHFWRLCSSSFAKYVPSFPCVLRCLTAPNRALL